MLQNAILEFKGFPSEEIEPYTKQEIIGSLPIALDLADIFDKKENNHEQVGLLLNSLGTFYPLAERKVREELLWDCVSFLDKRFGQTKDGVLEITANNYVKKIDEPILIRDLCMNRYFYSTNIEELESTRLLKNSNTWEQYKKQIIEHDDQISIFELRFPIIFPKYANQKVRQGFYEEEPNLTERIFKAASGFAYATALTNNVKKGVPMNDGISRALEDYDSSKLSRMVSHIEDKDWILWPHKSQLKQ